MAGLDPAIQGSKRRPSSVRPLDGRLKGGHDGKFKRRHLDKSTAMTYRRLEPTHITKTLERLEARIGERFPGSGLTRVCAELTDITRQAEARAREIAAPIGWLRGLILLLLAAGLALLAFVLMNVLSNTKPNEDLYGTLQGIDAAFNILVLLGGASFFAWSAEQRIRRRRAMAALYELRSIVHVIDMHQLTKDPSTEVAVSNATPSSPKRQLSAYEVMRYLDYCSEMLSLAAKVAVLYAQSFPDPEVTGAVNDLERTSAALSQKIWQKINIVERSLQAVAAPPPALLAGKLPTAPMIEPPPSKTEART
jgi:hypothetical protein